MALAYYSLGANAELGRERVRHYYDWLGEYGDQIASSVAADEGTVKGYVSAFEDAGCDELLMFAGTPDLDQVSLLRQAVG